MPATWSLARLRQAAAGLALVLAGSCTALAGSLPPAAPPPIPPGEARFWFYRVFFPDDTVDMPAVAMNGRPIGYAVWGTSFYRDVPAGRYHLTVASVGRDVDQSKDVGVAPGQEIYVKIDSLPSWEENPLTGYRRGTYYVLVVPPQLAALELPHTSYSDGY